MSAPIGADEDLPVRTHHDVYPTIDPQPHFSNQSFKGKVVIVTGASRGIGRETALHFARAGAGVALFARVQETLDETREWILREVVGAEGRVLTVVGDVRERREVEVAVREVVRRFGRVDVVVANAAAITRFDKALDEKDPEGWWNTFEVNIRGVYNFARVSVKELQKTKGYFVVLTSVAANLRLPSGSDYCISKHAVGRLVEFIALEYPELKTFAMHPGGVETQMAHEAGLVGKGIAFEDTPQLPASTILYLTSGKADWLNGRYLSANWDLGEVEREWKDRIVEKNGLVSKLFIPA